MDRLKNIRIKENVEKMTEILRNDHCVSAKLIERLTGISKSEYHKPGSEFMMNIASR